MGIERIVHRAVPVSVNEIRRLETAETCAAPFDSENYNLFLIIEGNIRVLLNERIEEIGSQSALLVLPGTIVYFLSDEANYYKIEFTDENRNQERNGSTIFMFCEEAELMAGLCKRLYLEEKKRAPNHELKEKILNFMLWLFVYENAIAEDAYDFVSRAKRYIEQHYNEEIKLSTLSEVVNISTHHLVHSFKEKMGISPIQYVIDCRIRQAKRLLRNTNMSIAQIAEQVGVENVSYFSILFKKMSGKTPAQYRKEQKRKNYQPESEC